jgi:diguanylate cyclase (GGDEF)-like protein
VLVVLRDAIVLAYIATAVVLAWVGVVTWRRRAANLTLAAALTVVMVGACWWSVSLIVTQLAGDETAAAIATLVTFAGPSTLSAAFLCLGLAVARPQWAPQRALLLALLIEPVLITLAAATNPWHQLVYRGAGAAQLTQPARWTYGPVFWLDTWFTYLEIFIGLGLIAWAWWRASPVFRGQRLTLFLGALVPLVANVVFVVGGVHNTLDPTPIGLAVTGTIVWYAVFRQNLITFSPVARALIIDQIGDAVMVISPGGLFLDLNPVAVELMRALNPDAPTKLVGAPALALVGESIATMVGRETELVVERPGGRAEFQVHASALVGRRRRALGTVYVARDVTEANALSRRLSAAHAQLIQQVETIDLLRAHLVEQASRDDLTGLHNRRHMVERFTSMIAAAEDAGEPLAVALFDVDRFKSINDNYGHLAGDAVLVALARLMGQQAPAGALVARWGGEEFFIALPGADAVTGLAFAEDLRTRCEEVGVVDQGRMIHCTVSGGVATYPAAGTTMNDLFHAADVALYEAKSAGRNLVRVHEHSSTIAAQVVSAAH